MAGNPLTELSEELDLKLYQSKSPEPAKTAIYSPEGPPLPLSIAKQLASNSENAFFEEMADFAQNGRAVPAHNDSLANYLKGEGKNTMHEGLQTEREKRFVDQMRTRWDGWTGAEQEEVSLRYWQSDQTFGGPDAVIVDGYRGIYENLAAIVRQDKRSEISLEQEVVSVSLSEDKQTVIVETVDPAVGKLSKQEHRASFVVCTLPLGVLQQRCQLVHSRAVLVEGLVLRLRQRYPTRQ